MTGDSVDLGIPGVTFAQRIGAGGNAIVYRARQPELDRTVVVKVLMVGDADATQRRFDRERRAMGRLSQAQGIAPVYDSGFTRSGQPYLIMPYYDHGSLQDRIELSGPLAAEDVRRIGVEIADAVQTAHDHGVLHRDLKPANILITRSGRADVADFGIAQILDDSGGRSQAITMTPLFTAPEIFDGAPPSSGADVYSLGALLFTLLNGRPAHADTSGTASVLSLMIKIKDQPLPSLPDDVPSDLASAVAKAMHKDPRRRFGSAAELATALRAADLTAPRRPRRPRAPARTPTPTDEGGASSREGASPVRARALAAVGGLAAIVGLVLAAWYFLPSTDGGTAADEVVQTPVEVPNPTPVETPVVTPAMSGFAQAQVIVESYSCGGIERTPGVIMRSGLVITAASVGKRPWRAAVVAGDRAVAATVVSYDEELQLASLQLDDIDPPLDSPRLGRAADAMTVQVIDSDGSFVTGPLTVSGENTFDLESSAARLDPGSAVVSESGALVGVVNESSPPQIVPLVGGAIEGWQPTAADPTCSERGAALGTTDIAQITSPHLRELLQLQRLSEAYASEDWDTVRAIEPGKASLDEDKFVDGWRPLEQSFLYPVDRDELAEDRVRWRLGLIGHERWDDQDLTTLFCVWWEVDPSTGSVIQTNEDTVRVFGSQEGESRRAGWTDPGLLLDSVSQEC